MIRCERVPWPRPSLNVARWGAGFVIKAGVSDEWEKVSAELSEAFNLSQAAAREGRARWCTSSKAATCWVVGGPAGHGGVRIAVGGADPGNGNCPGGRPGQRHRPGPRCPIGLAAFWVETLCRPGGPTGELILGGEPSREGVALAAAVEGTAVVTGAAGGIGRAICRRLGAGGVDRRGRPGRGSAGPSEN